MVLNQVHGTGVSCWRQVKRIDVGKYRWVSLLLWDG